jgi:hypothetical protein
VFIDGAIFLKTEKGASVGSNGFAPPGPPGNRRRDSVIPPRSSGGAPKARPGPGHRAFFFATRIEEAPHAPRVGAGAESPPPKPPPRPTGGSHCLGCHLGRASDGWQGPPEGPNARARQPLRAPHQRIQPRVGAPLAQLRPQNNHRPGQLAAHIALSATWGGLMGGRGQGPPEHRKGQLRVLGAMHTNY